MLDPQTGETLGSLDMKLFEYRFDAEGRLLVSRGRLLHYDLPTLTPALEQRLPPGAYKVGGRDRLLAVAASDETVQIYDLTSGEVLAAIVPDYPVDRAFIEMSERYVLITSEITDDVTRLDVWRVAE